MPLRVSVRVSSLNEEEVQGNNSSRHNSVTTAAYGQTTSQALTEAESQSTASHLFARRTRSFHRPTFIRPDMTVKLQRTD